MPTTEKISPAAGRTLPDTLRLGAAHLTVSDLDRSVAFYQRSLGLTQIWRDGVTAAVGTDEPVLVLTEQPGARRMGRTAGLYHVALLYPTRLELARAAQRLAATNTSIEGASDHLTHEAFYLSDPDGNGLELAADRPGQSWPALTGTEGLVNWRPQPLDVGDLMTLVAGQAPVDKAAPGLRVGHVHLHVGDIDRALAFYSGVLGFDEMANLGTAAFVSAGGYHHHLGLNVWNGEGVGPADEGAAGLRHWTIVLQDAEQVDAVRARLLHAGVAFEERSGGLLTRDPWRTAVTVQAGSTAERSAPE